MRAAVVAVALSVVLAACAPVPGRVPEASGTITPSATPTATLPPPVARAGYAELVAAVRARLAADHTVVADDTSWVTSGGQSSKTNSRVSVVENAAGPPSVRMLMQVQNGQQTPTITEAILTPDAAYVRPDRIVWPEPKLPWARLDPLGRDPLSHDMAPWVQRQRRATTGIGCLTDLGAVQVTRTAAASAGGVSTVRYDLHVVLDAANPDTAELRQRGFTAVDTALDVDGFDRIRRCAYAVSAPGGSARAEQSLVSQGEPITIEAPPADQVQILGT